MRVLLVDDDPFFRSTLRRLLQREGFLVIEAEDGREAYPIVQQVECNIKLLLTDINMPRMDGLELARLAKRVCPQIPVLAMTGRGEISGYSDLDLTILRKPFHHHDLLQAIGKLIPPADV
jgi:CheY-like chemotaxis protein